MQIVLKSNSTNKQTAKRLYFYSQNAIKLKSTEKTENHTFRACKNHCMHTIHMNGHTNTLHKVYFCHLEITIVIHCVRPFEQKNRRQKCMVEMKRKVNK